MEKLLFNSNFGKYDRFLKEVGCLVNVYLQCLCRSTRSARRYSTASTSKWRTDQTVPRSSDLRPRRELYSFVSSNRSYSTCKDVEVNDVINKESEEILKDDVYNDYTRAIFSVPGAGHRIFVVHPIVKDGVHRRDELTIQHEIEEAVALIETLHNWKVVDQIVLSTKNIARKQVFGSGNVERLQEEVNGNSKVTATFLNMDRLSGLQHAELEALLGMPIFDRYSIVLNIFKDHAKTKVAKLQVALAEIPHIRSRLKWLHHGGREKQSSGMQYIGGAGETFMEIRRRLLQEREAKLKAALKKVTSHRELLKRQRLKKDMPTVAVVGYTNAGKTTLIKSITGDRDMQPVDQMFATLDVTVHGGLLPCRMPVLFVDTVGFISNIPTSLIDSFHATLEDAVDADLIIHIRDLSHPETEAQKECVLRTLKQLKIRESLYSNILEVGNKIDRISNEIDHQSDGTDIVLISATEGKGLTQLMNLVEEKLITITEKEKRVFRVPNGGSEARWLYKEASVSSAIPDDQDNQFLFLEVIIGKSTLAKFHHYFGDVEEQRN